MSFVRSKHIKLVIIISFLFILANCQLQKPKNSHGINFLDNREKVLIIQKTNKNDVVKIIGIPHSVSLNNNDKWMYFERSITRGSVLKLGKNVLVKNNILELKFDKYGILTAKKIYNKSNMNEIKFSEYETVNEVSQSSFASKFLSSIKQKMYSKRRRK